MAEEHKDLSTRLLNKIKTDRGKDVRIEPKTDPMDKKVEALKQKFENKDFSLRERINSKFIDHLQTSKKFTLPQLLSRHVDLNKTETMIKDVFPPKVFDYQELEELKQKENKPKFDFDQEVCGRTIAVFAIKYTLLLDYCLKCLFIR